MMSLLLLWFTTVAQAIPNQYCFLYDVAFQDLLTGDLLTGENTKARGARVRFINEATGATTYAYLDWDGATPGCATVSLSYAVTWTIKVDRMAIVNGNTIEVRTAGGSLYTSTVITGFTPQFAVYYNYPNHAWTRLSFSGSVNIMSAAQWALQRRSGGVSAATFAFRTSECPAIDGACYDNNTHYIHIPISDPDPAVIPQSSFKYIIAHELGHALADAANGLQGVATDYGAPMGPCTSGTSLHSINSREYQSAAAVEGMGNFYAAIAFNEDNYANADCAYLGGVDWNHDGGPSPGEGSSFSCEGGIAKLGIGGVDIPPWDYVGTFCSATNNTGTEYDWLRALWDLRTDQGVSFDTILTIWNVSEPHLWTPSGVGSGGQYPANMLQLAAGSQALGSVWQSNAITNGTHR